MTITLRVTAAFVWLACSTACAATRDSSAAETATHVDSAGGVVIGPGGPYAEASGGPARLVIELGGDSTALVPAVTGTCEVAADTTSSREDAIVWVEGVHSGKPLSNDRRYELMSSGCALSPRVQAVLIGGAVDVFNDDAVLHRLVFLRAGTNDTLQTMPFTNDGQIVATDRLTRQPGLVEVRCAQHPQERAYIAVFDQPYFEVAGIGDKVSLDSIPAGDYRVRLWREGMTVPTQAPAKVGATGTTEIIVR